MKASTRLMENGSWNSRNTCLYVFMHLSTYTISVESPSKRKIYTNNLAIVNYTISRRNRRASDDPQDTQRDRQTRTTTHSAFLSLLSFCLLLVQERICSVASTVVNRLFWDRY